MHIGNKCWPRISKKTLYKVQIAVQIASRSRVNDFFFLQRLGSLKMFVLKCCHQDQFKSHGRLRLTLEMVYTCMRFIATSHAILQTLTQLQMNYLLTRYVNFIHTPTTGSKWPPDLVMLGHCRSPRLWKHWKTVKKYSSIRWEWKVNEQLILVF